LNSHFFTKREGVKSSAVGSAFGSTVVMINLDAKKNLRSEHRAILTRAGTVWLSVGSCGTVLR